MLVLKWRLSAKIGGLFPGQTNYKVKETKKVEKEGTRKRLSAIDVVKLVILLQNVESREKMLFVLTQVVLLQMATC